MTRLNNKITLVTGASRGIDATTDRHLTERGADIVVNYRSKGPRAEQVADDVRALGVPKVMTEGLVKSQADDEKRARRVPVFVSTTMAAFQSSDHRISRLREVRYADFYS